MSASVVPPRKCLVTLLHAVVEIGKLHCGICRNAAELTCLFVVKFSSFHFRPGVFTLERGIETKPEGVPGA